MCEMCMNKATCFIISVHKKLSTGIFSIKGIGIQYFAKTAAK